MRNLRAVWGALALTTAAFVAPRPLAGGQAERCHVCYCRTEYESATHGQCKDWADQSQYDRWRRNVEILAFDARTPGTQSFTRTIRNVTEDDDVYLRLTVGNPLLHTYEVSVSQSDATPRDVINVSGDGVASGLLAVAQRAAVASASAEAGQRKATDEKEKAEDKGKGTVDTLTTPGPDKTGTPPINFTEIEGGLKDVAEWLGLIRTTTQTIESNARRLELTGGTPDDVFARVELLHPSENNPFELLGKAQSKLEQLDTLLERASQAADHGAKAGLIKQQRAELTKLRTEVGKLAKALEELQDSLRSARLAAQEGEVCLFLGRFEAGSKVAVKVAVKDRPRPAASNESLEKARTTIERARQVLDDYVESEAGTGPRKTAAEKGSEAPAETDQDEGDDAKPKPKPPSKPKDVDRHQFEFEVLKPVHVQTGFGVPVSELPRPEFFQQSRTVERKDENDETISVEQVALVAKGDTSRQVRPAFFVSLYLMPQYYFAGEDDDPHESIKAWHRYVPFPVVGVTLTDLGDNYYLGGGVSLARGVHFVAGRHFGKVTALVNGFQENVYFDKPANFQLADATTTRFERAWFFGLSVDTTAMKKLLGAGEK